MPAWPTASTPPAAPTPAPAKIEILRLNVVLPRRATNLARRQRHRHPRHPFAKERPRGSTWLAEICKWLRHTGNGSDSLAADTIRCTALVCCPVPSDLRQQQVAVLPGSWNCCALWYLEGSILVHGVSFKGAAHVTHRD
jgi:hypothetical protein